jgi:hypothetical protein
VSYAPIPPTKAQPQHKNGLGTAGFVLGLVGLVFAVVPIIGVIAWPLTILGLIFGVIGLTRANRGQAGTKGMAITGVVLSAVGLVSCVIWTAAFGKAVTDAAGNVPAPAAPPSVQSSGAPAGRHTVVLEVTTAAKSNLLWTSGSRTTSPEVLEPGKTWSRTLSTDTLAWTSVSVSPVSYEPGGKDNTCKITVDGKTASEQANGVAALCTFQP